MIMNFKVGDIIRLKNLNELVETDILYSTTHGMYNFIKGSRTFEILETEPDVRNKELISGLRNIDKDLTNYTYSWAFDDFILNTKILVANKDNLYLDEDCL